MSVQITTKTSATSTAYSNQRKLDRSSNGVLWAMATESGNPFFYFSTDNGTTWTQMADTWPGHGLNGSIFIDLDDYMHVVVTNTATATIDYVRGTPNAGRTSYTWSAITQLYSTNTIDYADVVAHREGTGWKAHVVTSQVTSTPSNFCNYIRVSITSGGVITKEGQVDIGPGYGQNVATFPSIDFNHTGDGKTVAGSTPHLYAAWSAGTTGTGKGIRFKKATYSAGAWTWGTEREIDSTRYVAGGGTDYWINCLFDGTAVLIGGEPYTGAFSQIALFQRDAADTTTTTLFTSTAGAQEADRVERGSLSYDAARNVYLVGLNNTDTLLRYRKYNRSGGTLAASVALATLASSSVGYVSVKRGYSGSRIGWVYVDGSASPYSIRFDFLAVGVTSGHGAVAATAHIAASVTGHAPIFPWFGPSCKVQVALTHSPATVVLETDWTDVTTYVLAYNIKRGRSTERDVIEAGELNLTLDNADGRFTPKKATSPYYPHWTPRRPVRILDSDGTAMFYGSIVDFKTLVTADGSSVCTVECVDAFGTLSRLPFFSAAQTDILALGPVAFYPLTDGNDASEFGNIAPNSAVGAFARIDAAAGAGTIDGDGASLMPGYPNESSATFTNSTNSTTGSVLKLVNDAAIPTGANWTALFWVKLDALPPLANFVYQVTNAAATTAYYQIYVNPVTPNVEIVAQGAGATVISSTFAPDATVMVAVTIDTGNQAKVYINGSLAAPGATGTPSYAPSGSVAWVGAAGDNTAPGDFLNGQLGGLAFFNRALTATEIANLYNGSQSGRAGEVNTDRLAAVLDSAGWPSTARAITADTVQMGARDWSATSNPLEVILSTGTDSRLDVFAAKNGAVKTLSLTQRQAETSVATFTGQTAVEAPLLFSMTENDVINDVTIRRTNGVAHRVRSDTSIAEYGPATEERTVNLNLDSDAISQAQARVAIYAAPQVRTDPVTIRAVNSATWSAIKALDFGSRITISDLPATAPASSMDFFVESIELDATLEGEFVELTATVELSPVGLYGAT